MSSNLGKLLYIVFIDIDATPSSGSSVRPIKMLQAFRDINCDVTVLEGQQNRIFERHKKVTEILRRLRRGEHFDFCYIEPPSGPFLCPTDLRLLKELRKCNVPVGLFYRDAFYLFPESFSAGMLLKNRLISYMMKRDREVISKTCDIIYVPTASFGELVDFPNETRALPPGCSEFQIAEERSPSVEITGLYVGGVSEEYGSLLLLDSFDIARKKGCAAKLIFICAEEAWGSLPDKYKKYEQSDWLTVVHASGEKLEQYYMQADFGIIPRLKTSYNDIAFPVKLVEYISHGLPVLATSCAATEDFILHWAIGVVADDDLNSFSDAVISLAQKGNIREAYRSAIKMACEGNSWTQRACDVIEDLRRCQYAYWRDTSKL